MGSEMCIRDRVELTAGDRAGGRPQHIQQPAADLPVGARVALGPPCLLYTSDAADERSSVDLGGRRIIKKKKRTRSSRGDVGV